MNKDDCKTQIISWIFFYKLVFSSYFYDATEQVQTCFKNYLSKIKFSKILIIRPLCTNLSHCIAIQIQSIVHFITDLLSQYLSLLFIVFNEHSIYSKNKCKYHLHNMWANKSLWQRKLLMHFAMCTTVNEVLGIIMWNFKHDNIC